MEGTVVLEFRLNIRIGFERPTFGDTHANGVNNSTAIPPPPSQTAWVRTAGKRFEKFLRLPSPPAAADPADAIGSSGKQFIFGTLDYYPITNIN